jgi:UDP-perosamine 4-acetyltransferase
MNNGTPIVLLGGGGHALSVASVVDQVQNYWVAGFVDPKDDAVLSRFKYKVLGDNTLSGIRHLGLTRVHIAVGQVIGSTLRQKIFEEILLYELEVTTIVAPFSFVAKNVEIGAGTVVMPGAVVNAGAKIGKNVILNSGCVVEHGAVIGDFCHIAPRAVVLGDAVIGKNSFIGAGAIILEGSKIKCDQFVASGVKVNEKGK